MTLCGARGGAWGMLHKPEAPLEIHYLILITAWRCIVSIKTRIRNCILKFFLQGFHEHSEVKENKEDHSLMMVTPVDDLGRVDSWEPRQETSQKFREMRV